MEKNRYYYFLKYEIGMELDHCLIDTNGPLYEDNYEGRFDGYRDVWRPNYEDLSDYDLAS